MEEEKKINWTEYSDKQHNKMGGGAESSIVECNPMIHYRRWYIKMNKTDTI